MTPFITAGVLAGAMARGLCPVSSGGSRWESSFHRGGTAVTGQVGIPGMAMVTYGYPWGYGYGYPWRGWYSGYRHYPYHGYRGGHHDGDSHYDRHRMYLHSSINRPVNISRPAQDQGPGQTRDNAGSERSKGWKDYSSTTRPKIRYETTPERPAATAKPDSPPLGQAVKQGRART